MKFTKSYFKNEISQFWGMMGDKRYSVAEMDKAFKGLCLCYLHTEGIQPDDSETIAFEAASNNWERVRLYRSLGV